MTNKEKDNARLREYRKRTNNLATRKYEKTKKGFLMRCYRNMQSRINGVQKLKSHLYQSKELLPREDFYSWSLQNKDFNNLFTKWERESYNQKLTPSVNRVDSSKGYTLDNIEWITHSENSRRTTRWGYA